MSQTYQTAASVSGALLGYFLAKKLAVQPIPLLLLGGLAGTYAGERLAQSTDSSHSKR